MVERSKRFDGMIRRWIPSSATLSYNPLFKLVGYGSDVFWNLIFKEFRQLPPNHLRVRVGVGNQMFRNQHLCLRSGTNYWLNAFADQICRFDSNIVEIGCGYGRKAYHLLNYELQGQRFSGTYHGVDIDEELLAFARKKFPAPQYSFQLTPHKSQTYGTTAASDGVQCRIEREDDSQDFLFSTSLVTHLLEPELLNYITQSYRVLRPGGFTQMNFFCMDFLRDKKILGSRWTFAHRIGRAHVESQQYPEAAVAYNQEDMIAFYRNAGFNEVQILTDPNGKMAQSFVRARK